MEVQVTKNIKVHDYRFFCVVVTYNIKINESVSIKNINNINNINDNDINIIVADNSDFSDIKNINCKECKELGITYLNMGGNKGLTKAYNEALNYIENLINNNEKDIVVWLDDDSEISKQYFNVLKENLQNFPDIDIFTPLILGQDGKFWSPNKHRFFRNKQLKTGKEDIKNNEFNAINSCTAVRWQVYTNYRYDQNLFLDQVDHDFFRDQRKLNRKFKKIDVVIKHNFSLKNKRKSLVSLKKRYSIMIPDFIYYCSKDNTQRLGIVKVIGWGIRESFSIKDFRFFIWSLQILLLSIKKLREK